MLRDAGCVFAEDEARLLVSAAATPAELADMVDRRVAGQPLEQVVGWVDFCGLRIAVEPGVFVPRRRTELLVGQATELVLETAGGAAPSRTRVVDLCCGTGAVGVALAAALTAAPMAARMTGPTAAQTAARGRVELHAVDIDAAAVRCARRNVPAGARVHEGDLYGPLPAALRGCIDILVANVPYVPTEAIGTLPPEARMHEPPAALDGGADGLDVLRRVTAAAPHWLAPGGHLLVETSERQAAEAAEAFSRSGLVSRVARSDELNATVVIGTTPARQ